MMKYWTLRTLKELKIKKKKQTNEFVSRFASNCFSYTDKHSQGNWTTAIKI